MSFQDLPAPMHPRYQDFLGFMAYCPHRTSPSILEAAFWVWLNFIEIIDNNDLKSEYIKHLKIDLERLHRERDSFQQQARVLAEEVERLNGLFCDVYDVVGERGAICLSIDGGNL